jgi:hypothetical protein
MFGGFLQPPGSLVAAPKLWVTWVVIQRPQAVFFSQTKQNTYRRQFFSVTEEEDGSQLVGRFENDCDAMRAARGPEAITCR